MKPSLAGLRILVTGASSGIGQALAVAAARRGARVLMAARNATALRDLAESLTREGFAAVAHCSDVTVESDRRQMLAAAVDRLGGLDVLVNNAGILATGHFSEATPDRLRQVMETNFFAAAELMRGAIPLLRGSQQPAIVNIASITGRRAVPARPEYSASKFALIGLSEAVRAELAKDGINLLVVNPCFVNTQLERNTLESKARREWDDRKLIAPEVVAERTLTALVRRRHELVVGVSGKLLLLVNRLFPRLVDRLMARYVATLYEGDRHRSLQFDGANYSAHATDAGRRSLVSN